MIIHKNKRGDTKIPKDASYPACHVKYDFGDGKLVNDEDITEMLCWFYVVEYTPQEEKPKEIDILDLVKIERPKRKWYEFWK